MQVWLEGLRRLAEDPTQNAAAVGTGLAIVVIFVLIIVLLLIVVALPATRRPQAASSPEPRRRIPAWLSVTLIALLTASLLASALVLWYHDTSSNEYCTRTCHAMAIASETWATSAHAEVDCIRCHEGRKWESFGQGVIWRTQSLYLQATGSMPSGRKVPRDICLSCHRSVMVRPVTARNGEEFKHSQIDDEHLGCVRCHGAQGHVTSNP